MSLTYLFEKQPDRNHLLESFLIALSFTTQLESKYVKSIIQGFVHLERIYISNLKIRGWLREQNELLTLAPKAKRLVQLVSFEINANKKPSKQTMHEILLVRSLFIILLHLNFKQIRQIKKQKLEENGYIPDLIVTTQNHILYIEVDTGSEPISTIETKINDVCNLKPQVTLIYFTKQKSTYNHFAHKLSNVQFIYLLSPTISQDILKLTSNVNATSQPTSSLIGLDTKFDPSVLGKYKVAPNVFINNPELLKDTGYTLNYPENQVITSTEVIPDDDLDFLEGLEDD